MEVQAYEREHLEKMRKHLAECVVLLKSNGDFPLERAGKIALYGSGARHTVKGGTGSGEVNSRFFVTVEQALRDAGFLITTTAWLNAYDKIVEGARKSFIKEIQNRARKKHTMAITEGMGAVMPEPEYNLPLNGAGDTAVYVLSRISGEGNDREFIGGDILLSETEKRDILALQRKYQKFLLVLNVGGPVDLSPVLAVENILVLSQLGVETGSTLADLLLGKSYPSGKLTTTWAAEKDYPAIGDFGDINDTRYREGIYVGYRYFDSARLSPLFPFGFGLGYTDFSVSNMDFILDGEIVKVSAKVKNTGLHPGKETVQFYVTMPEGKLDQPYQSLAGFAKTGELQPGGEEIISITFPIRDLASFDADKATYVLEAGNYILRLGANSRDTASFGVVQLKETVAVKQVKNRLGKPDFTDWRPEPRTAEESIKGLKCLTMEASVFPATVTDYAAEAEIDPAVAALSDEELSYMTVGAFDPKGGVRSIIGNAGRTVAGAAGETTGRVKERGMDTLIMADGPAGLRLAKDYIRDSKGVYSLDPAMPESMLEFLSPPLRFLIQLITKKPHKGAEILHHYCTAIPIGTAIAQSWNPDFAKLCGDIVGEEMERFGIHLWLAPALNIHRDIRCGRNFEYFSEDPLVSGLFAAAITEGVQAHSGCGTTIKHFAANNQETNRYNSNSLVSERAMREIYLKGFELCIRKSQPYALMTSYNLLNGVHTSERRDLTEDVLRREFAYKGIVMTDWVIAGGTMNKASRHPAPEAWKVAAAGGDLFMPGGKREYRNVLNALRDGRLSRRQLEINATRLYRLTKKLVR